MTSPETSALIENAVQWPFIPILSRLGMSVGMGMFIGLEREHSQKTGVRTFTLTALVGCLGGLMGPALHSLHWTSLPCPSAGRITGRW